MTKELSKIELFCDDQSVGRIQRALAQIKGVYDVKTVPVINAEAKANGKVKARTEGRSVDLFAEYVANKQGQTFRAKDLQDWMESIGRERSAYAYMLKEARGSGLLSAKGKGTNIIYTVKP